MNLDRNLYIALNAALDEARERNHEYLTPEHLLFKLLELGYMEELLVFCSISTDFLKKNILVYLSKNIPITENQRPEQSISFQNVFERAIIRSRSSDKDSVDIGDFLIAIYDEERCFSADILRKAGLRRGDLLKAISQDMIDDAEHEDKEDDSEESFSLEKDSQNNSKRKKKKRSLLQEHAVDLVQLASEQGLDPVIGREQEIERSIVILCRRVKNNPLHIGEPGVGKTAITNGLAHRIARGEVPEKLRNTKIYSLDVGSLLAGTRYRGDFEKRIKQILLEIEKIGNVIIFIDEIHTLIGAGAVTGGNLDASNLIKPALADGRLRCIGATTHEEYKKYFEKDKPLLRRFQRIDVMEPGIEESVVILRGLASKYEQFHNVRYSDAVLRGAVEMSASHVHDRFLPDKAIDIIDEAGALHSSRYTTQEARDLYEQLHSAHKMSSIDGDESEDLDNDVAVMDLAEKEDETQEIHDVEFSDIERVISQIAQIPLRSLQDQERLSLEHLQGNLELSIFGQKAAIEAIVTSIKRSRAGFKEDSKPIASFLFVGPTGVGKTELAKSLASQLEIGFHRFDMSEYQEKHTLSRLLGAPPGYVGYEESGQLIDALRKRPHSVLLLDEIEKAHVDIYNILLQVMDYATITDSAGRKVNFQHCIIIMTSNAGAAAIGQPLIGFGDRVEQTDVVFSEINRIFAPEFRNRLDKVVLFNHLSESSVSSIVETHMKSLANVLKKKEIQMYWNEDVLLWIGKKAYSEEFGARNVDRMINTEINNHLIDEILFGKLVNGGIVRVTVQHKELFFQYES